MSSWIRKMEKAAAMGLGMILVLMLACGAFAEEVAEEPAVVETVTTVSVSPEAKISDREAASGYISQIMKGAFAKPGKTTLNASKGGGVARSQLTGREAAVYDALKPLILEVAAGQLASTEFSIPRADVYGTEKIEYKAEDLGVSAILGSDGKPTAEAVEAFQARTGVNYELAVDSLLADCPYELYWFDKTRGYSYPGITYGTYSWTDGTKEDFLSVPEELSFAFAVSADYAPNNVIGGYTVDITYGTAATTAAENARQVVESNKNKPDYQKLHAYKNYICGAVDYNNDAANENNHTPYGDPWQLIWVFDGDATTKVVCEGYSKAFQFLCDESTFDNTSVISVSGVMQGGTGAGNHMWNIVTMGDGYHYLADITNSDTDTIGSGGELFLKGYTSKESDTVYKYMARGNTLITYMYDVDTMALLESTGRLAVVGQADLPTVSVTTGGSIGQDVTLTFANPESGSDVNLYWEIFYNGADDTAESILWGEEYAVAAGDSREDSLIGSNFLRAGDYQVLLYINPDETVDYETLQLVSAADFTLAAQDIPAISVDFPETIQDGDTLSITVNSGNGTVEAIAVHFYGWDPETNESTWSRGVPTTPSAEGNTDTINYEEAGLMKAQVWGRVNGVWSQPVEITVGIYGNLSPATISGSESIRFGEDAVFEIQADYRAKGGSWRLEDPDGNTIAEGSVAEIPEDGPLTVTVPASAFTDGGYHSFAFTQADGEYLYGNETSFEFEVEKVLPLNYEIPESARAGEDVTIHWTPSVEAQRLSVTVYAESSDGWQRVSGVNSDGDVIIPGYSLLNAGNYMLDLYTYAEGWNPTSETGTLSVSENPDRPAAPNIQAGEAYAGISFPIAFDDLYDGAYVKLINTATGYENTWIGDLVNRMQVSGNESGTYQIHALIRQGNVWSEETIETITVQDIPEVTEITLIGTPDGIKVGEDWSATVVFPGTSGSVHAIIDGIQEWYSGLNGNHYCSLNLEGTTLASAGVTAGDYILRIEWDNGGETVTAEFPLTVTGETLEVISLTEGTLSVSKGENIRITGQTGSATKVIADWTVRDNHGGVTLGKGLAEISSEEEGVWVFEMEASEAGWYEFGISGMTGAKETGRVTFEAYVTDDSSLPAPSYTVTEDNGRYTISLQPGRMPENGESVTWHAGEKTQNEGKYYFYGTHSASDSEGNFTWTVWPSEYQEVHTFFFAYSMNQETYSAPVTVTISTDGAPYPVNGKVPITLELPETWPEGKDLSFTWTPMENVSNQRVWIGLRNQGETDDIWSYGWIYVYGEETFTIPGAYLSEGNYVIATAAEADTYFYNSRDYRLTVTENPDLPPAPAITLKTENLTNMTQGCEFSLGGTYDGCSVVLYQQDGSGNWTQYTTDRMSWSSSSYRYYGTLPVGTWKAAIRVKNGDTWSQPAELEFTVAEAPRLATPVLLEELGEIRLNSRFSVRIGAVENATSYSATLMRYADSGNGETEYIADTYGSAKDGASEVTLTFMNWNDNAAPGTYRINVSANASGYVSSTLVIDPVQVVAVDAPAAPTNVQICKADGTVRTAEELANIYQTYDGGLYARISYDQPFQTYGYRTWTNNTWDGNWRVNSSESIELDTPADTVLVKTGSRYSTGDYKLQVRVMVDDVWSEWSDEIAYSIVTAPAMTAPTVTPEKTNLTVGESLKLTITGLDHRANRSIQINVNDNSYSDSLYDLTEPVEVVLPEGAFTEGENSIVVTAYGLADDAYLNGSTTVYVTVTGARAEAPTVTWNATSGARGETLTAQVEAPGATEVEMYVTSGYGRESQYYPVSGGRARVPYEITYFSYMSASVQFRSLVNGAWSEWSDQVTISSTTPRPNPDIPDQEFVVYPDEVIPGQDLTLTLLPVEGITQYHINLYKYGYPYESIVFSEDYDEPGEITVPAGYFAEPGQYYFYDTAGVEGYPDVLVQHGGSFTIGEDAEGLAPLTISAEKETLAYQEEIEISLGKTEAEEISWVLYGRAVGISEYQLYGNNLEVAPAADSPLTGFTFLAQNESGEQYRIRAKAKVNGEWTAWSNMLELTTLPRNNVRLANPMPRVAAKVTAGEPAHVTWAAVELAEKYTVSWSGNGISGALTTAECQADIPTEGMTPGTYTVSVRAAAIGYDDDGHVYTVPFEITQDPAIFTKILTLPANLTTIESQAFADLTNVEAVRIPATVTAIAPDAFSGSDITILAPAGSYAADWAAANGYPLVTE